MSPSRPFILRPVATILLMVAILLVGLVAFRQLPISALPQVDYPTIQVLTFYPGASPDVVATTITAPLERQFGEMQGLSQMTSTSAGTVSVIVLQFNLALNIDVAEEEVQSAINAAQSYLPSDLPVPPVYNKTNPADAPILTLGITSDSMPLSQVEDLVDTRLAPKISQLNGVGLVSISGGQKPAVRIQVNPTKLSSYGINLEDVRTALTQTSTNSAKGNFDGPRQDYQIDSNDQITQAEGYNDVVVAYRNGAPVLVKDVATVINGVENAQLAAWMNTQPAIVLNIQRQPGANTISVVDSIKKILPQLEANLPAAVQITELTDLTTSIHASVNDVEFELMLTIGLVVLVIFLFLRSVRATTIPSVAVPLSLIGTFGAMYSAQLQPRQSFADGAHHLHRIRRRRCHRHDRKHRALSGRRRIADGGCSQRCGTNRFYDHVINRFPDRRPHSAALHERCGRPSFPRICRNPCGHHHHLGCGLADIDPDDVFAHFEARARIAAEPLVSRLRACV